MLNKSLVLIGIVALIASFAVADTVKISVAPTDVPDETEPRVNFGDAPAGYGPDSWQGPATGKTNWHARYLADGNMLSALFPDDVATMTINDIAEISYNTKRPDGTIDGRDWWIIIYTRPEAGDSWYHDRFISNYGTHTATGSWVEYSTDNGEMTFKSNALKVIGESTLTQLQAAAGSQLVEMISIHTDSGWDGFDGYIDGLEITLTNGNVGQVDFVPEPASLTLMSLACLAVIRRRK